VVAAPVLQVTHVGHSQLDDATMSRMIMRDGYAVPSTATGLGIDWDFAAVDRLAVARAAIGPA
jgi:L-alanine-DL-glutamate epimerase-like enolase superfamily enzyme